jgi:hypothetical protein
LSNANKTIKSVENVKNAIGLKKLFDGIERWPGSSVKVSPPTIEAQSRGYVRSGGDVMITIFCDFRQFSAIFANFRRKIGVFLEKQCYDHFFAKTSRSLKNKTPFFCQIFGENILKIITSVPGVHNS